MRTALLAAFTCTLLASCSTGMSHPAKPSDAPSANAASGAAIPPPNHGACNAGQVQPMVGKATTAESIEQARITAGATTVRVLKPGQGITKEFNGDRLNLYVDIEGTVLSISCG